MNFVKIYQNNLLLFLHIIQDLEFSEFLVIFPEIFGIYLMVILRY
jgi:hypothetical protein